MRNFLSIPAHRLPLRCVDRLGNWLLFASCLIIAEMQTLWILGMGASVVSIKDYFTMSMDKPHGGG